jgi:hypothetical protein
MVRSVMLCLPAILLAARATPGWAAEDTPSPPTMYDVSINGETFHLELNRPTTVQSALNPGKSYALRLQVSRTQLLRLNTVRLEYEMPAKVSDDRGRRQRTVRIEHQLGFSIQLIDLVRPLDAKAQEETLKLLADSVAKEYRKVEGAKLKLGEIHSCKYAGGAAGPWTTVSYSSRQGDKNVGHTCVAYVLSGPPGDAKFTVTCLIQYPDEDKSEVGPLVRKTLDSIRPLP